MLGWMLRRGDSATDAGADTTQVDQPDTPAPVFAARAFKSALFGTPARPSDEPRIKSTTDKTNAETEHGAQTPPKPQGILLTPGTGTSRRKRVSFGHEIRRTNHPSTAKEGETQKRTRLNDTLEKARQKGAKPATEARASRRVKEDPSDDEWEEADEDDYCSHDITVDLNEPHSQSGKYWKEEFQKYQQDAKVELDKMLQYKQLAKSYAREKDAEASQLAEKLKDEQKRVIEMEKRIAEGASNIASKQGHISDEASSELMSTLTKQTALAIQYRARVQELENQMQQFLHDKEEDDGTKGQKRRQAASPNTTRTLLETQRELRKARSQVRELGELRDEVKTLKTQLKVAEQRAAKPETGGKTDGDVPRDGTRAQDLRAQLRKAKEESRSKDDELRQLRKEFETFREETQVRETDRNGVLERAHNKISDLKKEMRTLKAGNSEPAPRPRSWHPRSDAHETAEVRQKAEAKTTERRPQPRTHDSERPSYDLANLGRDVEAIGLNAAASDAQSMNPRFYEDTAAKATRSEITRRATPTTLAERPNLERPRWQPFVPRSPRNRAYLDDDLVKPTQQEGDNPAAPRPQGFTAPDLPALAKSLARNNRAEKADGKVDLLRDQYVRLGGPDVNNSTFLGNTSALSPDRRAAVVARIERRMAEKKRARSRKVLDKENLRP
ncbi:hypothetical protein G7046_g9205 [Stylonectria norvegica]|nr:hypothetical protein G7046_g9205 [Stylonectria norvegica]